MRGTSEQEDARRDPATADDRIQVDMSTMLVHMYRGEMDRLTAWLDRVDRTTNWAVATTTALLTFALGDADNPHGMLLLGMGSLMFFLGVEARRYRTYDVWRSRTSLLERNLFAPALTGELPEPGWRARLAEELAEPRFTMPLREALGRRLRRAYNWLFAVLLLGWLGKLLVASEGIRSLERVPEQATIGVVPGWVVCSAVALFYAGLLALALLTRGRRHASSKIRRWEG